MATQGEQASGGQKKTKVVSLYQNNQKKQDNQLLNAALLYAELGYKVFPCAPNGKHPLGGHGFKDATCDTEQIERWWAANPTANIGMHAEGLLVIDVDGSENSWPNDEAKANDLMVAPMALTPSGGRHYVFSADGKAYKNSASKIAHKVDVRGDDGYIVVWPSMFEGNQYQWPIGCELQVPPDQLPTPPAWLVESLTDAPAKCVTTVADTDDSNSIIEGGRNHALTGLGGTMRRYGLAADELGAALQQINQNRCKPPLPPGEVEDIANSVGRYEPDILAKDMAWKPLGDSENEAIKRLTSGTTTRKQSDGTNTHKANYITGTAAISDWKDDLYNGSSPLSLTSGTALADFPVGPGLVTLVGGHPGSGKSAMVMQMAIDALRCNDGLKVAVVSVEMTETVTLDRQLARLSGVPLDAIKCRKFDKYSDRVKQGLEVLEAIGERLAFIEVPFDVKNIYLTLEDFFINDDGPRLLIVDYVQRIGALGKHADARSNINSIMGSLRHIASKDIAVVCVAALARQAGKGGSGYDGNALTLASFRESSELEYGADSAFILIPDDSNPEQVMLKCFKNRHGEPRDIALHFQRNVQSFTEPECVRLSPLIGAALEANQTLAGVCT